MQVSNTEHESMFSSLISGINVYVMNTFQKYEEEKRALIEALKQEREKNAKLTKELENKESSENRCK